MEKVPSFLAAFAQLGSHPEVDLNVAAEIEAFICSIYGKPRKRSVNEVRFMLFQQHFAPKSNSQPMEQIKGTDPCQFPPCQNVLMQKLKRANLVAAIYKNALLPNPSQLNPEENGWILDNDLYSINWYDGRQVPEDVSTHIDQDIDAEQDDDDIHYNSSSDESEISDNDLE